MEKMKNFVLQNKKSLLIFLGGVFTAFLVTGIIFYVYHEKEQERIRIEMREQQEKRKMKEEEKKRKEKIEKLEKEKEKLEEEKKELEKNNTSNYVHSNESVDHYSESGVGTEGDVIAYFQEQERYASSNEADPSIRERLKSGVSTIYQFLFHGGTIRGKTFKELSSSAKLQVLKIALSIDSKIEQYFPNYKQNIKQGASNLKSKIVITYLETTHKICTNYEDVCTQAREDFKTMKDSFKISFSLIAGLAMEGGSAIKEWYLSTK